MGSQANRCDLPRRARAAGRSNRAGAASLARRPTPVATAPFLLTPTDTVAVIPTFNLQRRRPSEDSRSCTIFVRNACWTMTGGRKKLSRRKSRGTGRVSDSSGSEALSRKDSTGSSTSKKKRIRVRNLRTEDEEGNHGQYTGYVNNDHQPDGDGVMKYTDGSRYDGVWNEGSKVHGKTTKRKV